MLCPIFFPWFSLPLLTYDSSSNAVKNITVLYHTVILILSIDIVKNTHAVLLDFFSQVGRGNGSFIVHDGSVTIHGRTLSDAPCITIFIQL